MAETPGGGKGWEPELAELRRREVLAEELGGPERVRRQHDGGRLTIRERVGKLVDPGSFHEVGKDAFGKLIEREVSKRIYSTPGETQ